MRPRLWWLILGMVLVTLLSGGITLDRVLAQTRRRAPWPPRPIRTHRLELVDEQGKVLAVLRASTDSLTAARASRVALRPSLELRDEQGRLRSRLGLVEHLGSPELEFYDEWGKLRAHLELLPESMGGSPALRLYDESETLRAVLGATSVKTRWGAAIELPASSLLLFDKDGRVLFQAPLAGR